MQKERKAQILKDIRIVLLSLTILLAAIAIMLKVLDQFFSIYLSIDYMDTGDLKTSLYLSIIILALSYLLIKLKTTGAKVFAGVIAAIISIIILWNNYFVLFPLDDAEEKYFQSPDKKTTLVVTRSAFLFHTSLGFSLRLNSFFIKGIDDYAGFDSADNYKLKWINNHSVKITYPGTDRHMETKIVSW